MYTQYIDIGDVTKVESVRCNLCEEGSFYSDKTCFTPENGEM